MNRCQFLLLLLCFALSLSACTYQTRSIILEDTTCQPPCFKNIVPGQTSQKEALQILKSLPEVYPQSVFKTDLQREPYPSALIADLNTDYREDRVTVYIQDHQVKGIKFNDHSSTLQEALDHYDNPEYLLTFYCGQEYQCIRILYPSQGIVIDFAQKISRICSQEFWQYVDTDVQIKVRYFGPDEFEWLLSNSWIYYENSYEDFPNYSTNWDPSVPIPCLLHPPM